MPTARTILIASTVLVVGVALTGCVPDRPISTAGPTASASAAPSASAPATTAPTPTPSETGPTETGTPVTIGCANLVSAQAFYDYNPNFGLDASFVPEKGTAAASAAAIGGLACRWTNQTSGETIDIAVAHPTDAGLAARKAAATAPVTEFGPDGYFSVSGGAGTAQLFSGVYWITASSGAFFEPLDAADLVAAARSALG